MSSITDEIAESLAAFAKSEKFVTKGPLCVALFVSRIARNSGLPISIESLVGDRRGQVAGLGKIPIQNILADYDILRTLAEEGGRTSRGSIDNATKYAQFLNQNAHWDLEAVELWWVNRVLAYFASMPFKLNFDQSKSLRFIIRGIIAQAVERQKESPGTTYAGTVLQHLIGAKLTIRLPGTTIGHHGASVSDSVSDRSGDFVIGSVAIHSTTAPGEALMRKCKRNLEVGIRPIIVTFDKGVLAAEVHAEQLGIADRVDILEADQFLAGNLHELGAFDSSATRTKAQELINAYNEIIAKHETDPSLRIEAS